MTFQIIDSAAEPRLDWMELTDALAAGHRLPEAQLEDVVMRRRPDTMLSRHAWIDGLGIAVKTCQIFPENGARQDLPSINGVVTLFSDTTGQLEAVIDFHLVTKWKTAGDSLLAARRLARPDSREILIIGAGTVARSLVEAYSALFPDARRKGNVGGNHYVALGCTVGDPFVGLIRAGCDDDRLDQGVRAWPDAAI